MPCSLALKPEAYSQVDKNGNPDNEETIQSPHCRGSRLRLFQPNPGQEREYCNSVVSVRSVPVTQGAWTKVEKMGVTPFCEAIVTLDLLLGIRRSGSKPPIVYFDDFSLTPVAGGY
jgi:hypothetical protein